MTFSIHLAVFIIGWCTLTWAEAQDKALSPKEIRYLIPAHIDDFDHDRENIKGKLMQIGDLEYSFCEHLYTRKKQVIKVLLFDYKEASIMYDQLIKQWSTYKPILSDSLVLQPMELANGNGWESYYRASNTSKIIAVINGRFFLSMTGEEVDLETLNGVLKQIDTEKFPK
jgi:hypothetical protein